MFETEGVQDMFSEMPEISFVQSDLKAEYLKLNNQLSNPDDIYCKLASLIVIGATCSRLGITNFLDFLADMEETEDKGVYYAYCHFSRNDSRFNNNIHFDMYRFENYLLEIVETHYKDASEMAVAIN